MSYMWNDDNRNLKKEMKGIEVLLVQSESVQLITQIHCLSFSMPMV